MHVSQYVTEYMRADLLVEARKSTLTSRNRVYGADLLVEVRKKHFNFRMRQFKEKCHFDIAANLTLKTMVSFIIHLITHIARIACPDRNTQDNYSNPPCTCVPTVNNCNRSCSAFIYLLFSREYRITNASTNPDHYGN